MAEIGYQFVHHGLRRAHIRPEFFEGRFAEQVGPDAMKDYGRPKALLLNRVGLGDPAKCSAEDLTDTLKVIIGRRKRFEKIHRMATVGEADVIFGKCDCFHPRHFGG